MSATTTNPAEIYDDFLVPALFRPWADEFLQRVGIHPGDRVLDIACGTGAVTWKVAARADTAGSVVGLDVSPPMLEVARSHPAPDGKKVRWVEGTAEALPFDDQAFDVVLCQQGIQFAPDRDAAIREMRRVLRPTGRLGVSVWRAAEHQELLGAIYLAIERQFGKPANDPFSFGDTGAVRKIFQQGGFSHVRVEPVRLQVRFPSLERLVRLTVLSAAAVLPELAQASDAERETAIAAIREDIASEIDAARDGEGASFFTESHIVTATA